MNAGRAGEICVAGSLAALGVLILAQATSIGGSAGFSGVGPRAFPYAVGGLMVVLAALLARESFAGGFRSVEGAPGAPGEWLHFGAISAGVLVHMAIIAGAGFVIASTVLFVACAFGFGSRRLLRDVVVGFVLAVVVYLVFARGLSINLPGGPLRFLAG